MTISCHRPTNSMFLILLLLPALVACNLSGGGNAVDQNANATATAIFQTLDAQSAALTAQAGSPPQAPAATAQPPAETQPPAATQPAAQTQPGPLPGQATAASGGPTVTATTNTNCRSGPDRKYPKVSNLGATLRAAIQGKDATGTWWYIQNNKKAGGFCWVSSETTKVEGDTSNLPIIQAITLDAAQTQAAQTEIPQAPVAPVNPTATATATP